MPKNRKLIFACAGSAMILFSLSLAPAGGTTFALPGKRSQKGSSGVSGILLRQTPRAVVPSSIDSLTMYDVENGRVIRQFLPEGMMAAMDVDPQERFLGVARVDGKTILWNLQTGKRLWEHVPSGRCGSWDISFSADGKSLIVADLSGRAFVHEAKSGKLLRTITLKGAHFTSAALSPDGPKAALSDWKRRLYIFDARTGQVTDTGFQGRGQTRFSTDG